MFNLTRMEIRRALLQKSTYIILSAVVLVYILYAALIQVAFVQIENNETVAQTKPVGIEEQIEPATTEGDSVQVEVDLSSGIALWESGEEYVIQQFSGLGLLVFIIIFASMFFTSPYRNGYVKNFLGLQKNRRNFIVAQFTIGALYSILVFIVGTVTMIINNSLFFSDDFAFNNIPRMILLLGAQLFAHLAFVAVLLFLATVTRSITATLTAGLLYPLILHRPICDLLSFLTREIINVPADWSLRNYTVIGSINNIQYQSTNNDLILPLVVSAVIMTLSLVGSFRSIQKQDV